MKIKRNKLLAELHLFCKVRPLQRPRLNRGNVYQPKNDQMELYREVKEYAKYIKIDKPYLIVDVEVSFRKRNNDDNIFPIINSYGDGDNILKAVNDALVYNNIISDDRFIISNSITKSFGEEDYCNVKIYNAEPRPRGTDRKFTRDTSDIL